jgi:hypothetical protein
MTAAWRTPPSSSNEGLGASGTNRDCPQSEKCAKKPPSLCQFVFSGVPGGREKDEKRQMVPCSKKLPGDHVPVCAAHEERHDISFHHSGMRARQPLGGREGDEIKKKKSGLIGVHSVQTHQNFLEECDGVSSVFAMKPMCRCEFIVFRLSPPSRHSLLWEH